MAACKATGCNATARSKGLCGKHYMRLRRHGDYRDPQVINDPLAAIREYLSYNAKTGEFRWIAKPRGRGHPFKVGSIAGGQMVNGYITICFARSRYYAHRLAWWWIHGEMPERIDHRNGDKKDNRAANLRLATAEQNARNSAPSNGRQFKGAYFRPNKGKWQGAIGVDGRFVHLGYFDTEEEAARAYDKAANDNFGEFARLNFGRQDNGRAA